MGKLYPCTVCSDLRAVLRAVKAALDGADEPDAGAKSVYLARRKAVAAIREAQNLLADLP